MNFREFAQHKFDVIVLLFLYGLILLTMHQALHHASDASLISWSQHALSNIEGALLAILTGRALRRGNDGNGNLNAKTSESSGRMGENLPEVREHHPKD